MFGVMKNAGKEAALAETVKLTELEKGCGVGFGFMPQKNISGKRMPVTAVSSYLFDGDNFTAYHLENDSADVSLIVAQDDEPSATYLALSQRIEPRMYDVLFSTLAPQNWFMLRKGDVIAVHAEALSAPTGWLTARYKMVLSAQGRFMEGDYRQSGKTEWIRQSRPCDYVLFVDDEFSHALEAERYKDGTMNVFATVYRPSTDIGEITRSPRVSLGPLVGLNKSELPRTSGYSVEKIEHVSPAESAGAVERLQDYDSLSVHNADEAAAFGASSAATEHGNEKGQIPTDGATAESSARMPELSAGESKVHAAVPPETMEVKYGQTETPGSAGQHNTHGDGSPEEKRELIEKSPMPPIGSAASSPGVDFEFPADSPINADVSDYDHMLACDLSLALRLIHEAQLNHLSLSDLIRKIVDLPRSSSDKILIPFALNPEELSELAARYNTGPRDIALIKTRILDELHRFAGHKSELTGS